MSDKAKKTKSKKESTRKTPKPKPAVETKGLADAPMLSSSEDKTLGTLPDDLEMKTANEQAPKRSIQKQQEKANGDMPENKEASVPGDLSAEADTAPAEPLHLPRGSHRVSQERRLALFLARSRALSRRACRLRHTRRAAERIQPPAPRHERRSDGIAPQIA